MVSSPASKRKRLSDKFLTKQGIYEVDEVIGYKLVKSELRFFIQWKGFDT